MMNQNISIIGEDTRKRTENSKHFLRSDGSYQAVIGAAPVHYVDDSGEWQDIDTDLHDEADFDLFDGPVSHHVRDIFHARRQVTAQKRARNELDRSKQGFVPLRVPFVAEIPRQFKNGYSIGKGENKLKFRPVGASKAIGNVNRGVGPGSIIEYAGVWNDTDVTLEVTDRGVKETIILKSSLAPKTFTFEVTGPMDGDIKILPAWLEDANGERRDVRQTIRTQGARKFVDLVADVAGLVYPIAIDPTTVTLQPSSEDAYVRNDNAAANFGGGTTLQVGNYATNGTTTYFYRALLKFALPAIPANAVVSSATLRLWVYSTFQSYDAVVRDKQHVAGRITGTWTEVGVTWNSQPNQAAYSAVKSLIEPIGTSQAVDFDIKTDMQAIVQDPSTYNGFYVQTSNGNASNWEGYIAYHSREQANTSFRPMLFFTYSIPPTAPIVTAPNGGETWNAQHTIQWSGATSPNLFTSTVVASAYDTNGNNGRKLVKLSNGWLVAVAYDGANGPVRLYVSKDDGATFTSLCNVSGMNPTGAGFTIVAGSGTMVHLLVGGSLSPFALRCGNIDVATVSDTNIYNSMVMIETQNGGGYGVSVVRAPDGTLHAAWASKNSTYPNAFNIRYSKSTDNGATWAAPTQMTTSNLAGVEHRNPVIIVRSNGYPVIIEEPTSSVTYISAFYWNGAAWSAPVTVHSDAYSHSSPSAAVAPNGRIWVVWFGTDAANTAGLVAAKYSDDGGVTWVNGNGASIALTGNNQFYPTIFINSSGKVFVYWYGVDSAINGTYNQIRNINFDGTSWSSIRSLTANTTNHANGVSAIMDNTLNTPDAMIVYRDTQATAVKFAKAANMQYHIQVSTNNGGTWSDIVALTAIGVTSYTYDFTPVAQTSQAKVRIRVWDGFVYGAYDESNAVFTIQHNQLPTTAIASPQNNVGYLVGLRPKIILTPTDADANTLTDFQIQIASDSGFVTILMDQTESAVGAGWSVTLVASGGSVAYTPQADLTYGTRYIRARVFDGTAWGNWSATAQVTFTNPNWSNPNIGDSDYGFRKPWVDELRTHINAIRQARGLAAFDFSANDAVIAADSTLTRKPHIDDLRIAIKAVLDAIGTVVAWTDPVITAGTMDASGVVTGTDRKGIHIKELRSAAVAG